MTAAEGAERRRAVARAGHEGDVALARAALDDDDAAVRATAIGALERCAALTADELTAALADPARVVVQRACEATARRPGDEPPSLVPMLGVDDPTIVEVAAWASGERSPAEAGVVEVLAALTTGHTDALVREAAVAALGAIGDDDGLPAILQATSDKATVRRRAVLALAPFDGPEVDAALARARDDRDWQVRQAAEDLAT